MILKHGCLRQFNCADGSCIPLDFRCDSWVDCEDATASDEANCTFLDMSNIKVKR
jgi:hypothetical protein